MVIVDLDGTLTKVSNQATHCMGHMTKEEILKVMDPVKIAKLEPRTEIIELVKKHFESGDFVAIITGRWSFLEAVTQAWLKMHNVRHHMIGMRWHNDWQHKATTVKIRAFEEMIDNFKKAGISTGLDLVTWIDDDKEMLGVVHDKYPDVQGMLV